MSTDVPASPEVSDSESVKAQETKDLINILITRIEQEREYYVYAAQLADVLGAYTNGGTPPPDTGDSVHRLADLITAQFKKPVPNSTNNTLEMAAYRIVLITRSAAAGIANPQSAPGPFDSVHFVQSINRNLRESERREGRPLMEGGEVQETEEGTVTEGTDQKDWLEPDLLGLTSEG
jgi:hypothetical protein